MLLQQAVVLLGEALRLLPHGQSFIFRLLQFWGEHKWQRKEKEKIRLREKSPIFWRQQMRLPQVCPQ